MHFCLVFFCVNPSEISLLNVIFLQKDFILVQLSYLISGLYSDFLLWGSSVSVRLPWWLRRQIQALPAGSACSARDLSSIPGSRISPGEGNSNPLQYTCLENSMDGGGWWVTVHGVTKSWTRLNYFTFFFLSQYQHCWHSAQVNSVMWELYALWHLPRSPVVTRRETPSTAQKWTLV